MKKPSLLTGFILGLLLTTALAAILYVIYRVVSIPYPPFDLFNLAARALPGDIIRFGERTIIWLVQTFQLGQTDVVAKQIEQFAIGIPQWILLGAIFSVIGYALARDRLHNSANLRRDSQIAGLLLGVVYGFAMLILTAQYDLTAKAPGAVTTVILSTAYLGWGWAHAWAYRRIFAPAQALGSQMQPSLPAPTAAPESPVYVMNRREFLVKLGGSTAVITVVGAGLGALLSAKPATSSETTAITGLEPTPGATKVARVLPNADDPLIPAPGTRLEYTPLEQHYRIDVSTSGAPRFDRANYKLTLNGLVEKPTEISLDEVRALPSMDQYITMSCISNPVGGDLIGTTLWTGVSMQRILDIVKPAEKATHIRIDGADGFFEYLSIDLIRKDPSVMLTYAWDGQPLPDLNGWPLRIHIPDRYGMKQPKWITQMEFVESWKEGYWVVRGWDPDAIVKSTSVIDTVAVDKVYEQDGKKLLPVGGIAWAGVRGISKVEVQVDDGTWAEAKLRRPMSDRTWVIWRYDWEFSPGQHTFYVRCYEASGALQPTRLMDVAPSGAAAIHAKTVRIDG